MRFMEYGASAAVANVVVDGSPNDATVLLLTHWPGFPQPDGTAAHGADAYAHGVGDVAFREILTGR